MKNFFLVLLFLPALAALPAQAATEAPRQDIVEDFFERFAVTAPEDLSKLMQEYADKISKMKPEDRKKLVEALKTRLKNQLSTFNRERAKIHEEHERLGLKNAPDNEPEEKQPPAASKKN